MSRHRPSKAKKDSARDALCVRLLERYGDDSPDGAVECRKLCLLLGVYLASRDFLCSHSNREHLAEGLRLVRQQLAVVRGLGAGGFGGNGRRSSEADQVWLH